MTSKPYRITLRMVRKMDVSSYKKQARPAPILLNSPLNYSDEERARAFYVVKNFRMILLILLNDLQNIGPGIILTPASQQFGG